MTAKHAYSADFDRFWKLYPSGRGGKLGAYLIWQRRVPSHASAAEVIAGLEAQLKAQMFSNEERFIPHARTWLHQGRWADELRQGAHAGAASPEPEHFDGLFD